MKLIGVLLFLFVFYSFANGKEHTYIGSTPAGTAIRLFLGITVTDSVDFIQWKVVIRDNAYQLHCNYGISKANTNGFINDNYITLSGECIKQNNHYLFRNGSRTLKALAVNANLLHLLNSDNSLLVGNSGWSYTLNNSIPTHTDQISIVASPTIFKDSIVFEGRTPCNVPGVADPGKVCYKMKWHVVFYANDAKNETGTFRIAGTRWRNTGGVTGNWKVTKGGQGETIYELSYNDGNKSLFLLKLNEDILVFTDNQGKLLVGDKDFSYTLNSRR